MSNHAWDKTYEAVEGQLSAMGVEVFEIGVFERGDGGKPQYMLLRTWDRKSVLEAVPWLRQRNWHDSHIYVRPKGESNLTMIDDLQFSAVTRMRQVGFHPAAVVQTSPGNYQAWIKHPMRLEKELGTAVARTLAERFGGDVKAADWRHFGRLAGFRNTKTRHAQIVPVPHYDDWRSQNFHRDLEGQWVDRGGQAYSEGRMQELYAGVSPKVRFPFVRLIEASGVIAEESHRLVTTMRGSLERERVDRERATTRFRGQAARERNGPLKDIEAFRADPKYRGDGTRVDLAYAVYAVARGADVEDVRAALRSRDLSHKGSEKRQNDYIERTVRKAILRVGQERER